MNSVLQSITSSSSHHLNPTTTIVRAMPIIAEAWIDEAIQQHQEKHEHEHKDEDSEEVKPPTEFQIMFMKGLLDVKEKLKPTLTEIKCGIKHDSLDESSDFEHHASSSSFPVVPVSTSKCTPTPTPHPQEEHLQPTSTPHPQEEHLQPDYGWSEAHGFRGNEQWELPLKIKHCEEEARPGYATKLAHEYADTPFVLQEKVFLLAHLLQQSEHCLLYTGAGISTASGIGDYATRSGSNCSGNSTTGFIRTKIRSPYEAQPTFAHRAFVALHREKFIDYWVQQNHDGLPQKVI